MTQVYTRLEDVMKIDLTSVLVDDQTRALRFTRSDGAVLTADPIALLR